MQLTYLVGGRAWLDKGFPKFTCGMRFLQKEGATDYKIPQVNLGKPLCNQGPPLNFQILIVRKEGGERTPSKEPLELKTHRAPFRN